MLIPDTVPALLEAIDAPEGSTISGPPEARLRGYVNILDRIAETRRALEFHRADLEARREVLRREVCQSETPEEFDAMNDYHADLVADLGRLDRGILHADASRARALEALALVAAAAAASP
jgi:hypothetical protein